MSYREDKVANSFFLPRRSMVRGFASLLDFTSSDAREFTEGILARSNADAIGADWAIVGKGLRQALNEYDRRPAENGLSER